MVSVLHVIQNFSRGGAARAMAAVAKCSAQAGNFQHRAAALNTEDTSGISILLENGMEVIDQINRDRLFHEIERADIVLLNWWNNPEMDALLRDDLPPARLVGWFHVAGDVAPQVITPELTEYLDFSIACSPHTYLAPGIQVLPDQERLERTGMVYGAADFDRIGEVKPKAHDGFNVGYIGTVHYLKMHPRFTQMNAAVNIPAVKFIVCGSGDGGRAERDAQATGVGERFEFRGYVDDIKPVLEILDVYGYPLCEETYAAAEVNLQEVMYAGIPPVVFPYGGVKLLVKHNETGLVVHTENEYREAIEFLYHNPTERARLGRNAAEYARRVFGARNAAGELNRLLEKIMEYPKQKRVWGKSCHKPLLGQEVLLSDAFEDTQHIGARRFVDSLGNAEIAEWFRKAMNSQSDSELLVADTEIAKLSEIMLTNGLLPYRKYYREDGFLMFWTGLATLAGHDPGLAGSEFVEAIKQGCNHWRLGWYLAQAAIQTGNKEAAKAVLNLVLQARPNFAPAVQLQATL